MFKREETGAAPGRDEGSVSATLVGQGTSFNGVLRVNGSLRVEGEVEGEVTVSQQVIVGTGGVIKADIRADGATIGGRVRGRVQARGKVVLLRGGRLEGDVHAAVFQIEDGAFFQGNCSMGESAAPGGAGPAGARGPRGD